MTEYENIARKLQRRVRDETRKLENATRKVKAAYDKNETKKRVEEKAKGLIEDGKSKYQGSAADDVVKKVKDKTIESVGAAASFVKKVDEKAGVSVKTKESIERATVLVIGPTKKYMDDKGISGAIGTALDDASHEYGKIRGIIKPYFAPESAEELLLETQKQLTSIVANIFQISRKDAEGWTGAFGKVVTSKVAGVAGSATLFGLVSTFGTAGTGTAISTLSGAAANSAALAALGFGGGVAAGALVLTGVGAVIGLATYKVMSSKPRDYESLHDEDKQIIETCGILSTAISERLKEEPLKLSAQEAIQFRSSLEELFQYMQINAESICERLDSKNALRFREHILIDFQRGVLNGFDSYASQAPKTATGAISITGAIGGVFYALLTRSAIDDTPEQKLVLEALRRSKKALNDASESELSDYLQSLEPAQLQGVANNVKGIYHEMMWVETYNANNTETYADIFGSTSHQGSDVVIRSAETGDVIAEYQLKATDSESYVRLHQTRYKDIEVRATDEVSQKIDGVETSGFKDATLTENVEIVFVDVSDNTLGDRVVESAEFAGLAAAGLNAIKALKGKTDMPTAGVNTLRTATSAAAATGITAYLFG